MADGHGTAIAASGMKREEQSEQRRPPKLFIRDFAFGTAIAGHGSNDTGAGVDAPDAIVNFIRNVQISGRVQRDAASINIGFHCRAAVAAVTFEGSPCIHGNLTGAIIHPADGIGDVFDEEDIPLSVRGDVQKIADAGA